MTFKRFYTRAFSKLGWILFFLLAGWAGWNGWMGDKTHTTIGLCLAGAYALSQFTPITYPNLGILFAFGKLIGVLGAGWHMSVPIVYRIKPQERKKIRVTVNQSMQIPIGEGGVTEAKLKFVMDVILSNDVEHVSKALLLEKLDPEYLDDFFEEILASEARTLAGAVASFETLLKEQNGLQEQMLRDLEKKVTEKHGFLVEFAELSGIEEEAHKTAGRMRVVAKGLGQQAREVADPLKDNPWAALVMAVNNVTQAWFAKEKDGGERKSETKTKPEHSKVVQAVGSLVEGTENLIRKGGEKE